MTGELLRSTSAEEPSVAASEIAVASHERGSGGVAILLAIAAVVAAIIGARASMVSNDANDSWQSALRTEVKRSAAAMADVQTLYESELPVAIEALQAKVLAEEMSSAQAGQSPAAQQALAVEASVQSQLVTALSAGLELAQNSSYALPSGGYDLGKRLADIRARNPDLVALNPDGIEAAGDRLAQKAVLLTYALVPTSLCALLGVLAQPLRRDRGWLLSSGFAALLVGVVMAVGTEVLA
ncbi:MAG: hypothetical protein ABSA21_07010 [Candidatus Limnocylindrales bacterium]|jgi:hypothetical protein